MYDKGYWKGQGLKLKNKVKGWIFFTVQELPTVQVNIETVDSYGLWLLGLGL